jgi:hypothetical protein
MAVPKPYGAKAAIFLLLLSTLMTGVPPRFCHRRFLAFFRRWTTRVAERRSRMDGPRTLFHRRCCWPWLGLYRDILVLNRLIHLINSLSSLISLSIAVAAPKKHKAHKRQATARKNRRERFHVPFALFPSIPIPSDFGHSLDWITTNQSCCFSCYCFCYYGLQQWSKQ